MRNFDDKIKELFEDIEKLKLTKKQKETQLRAVKKEQREVQRSKVTPVILDDNIVRDHFGKPIFIDNRVSVVKKRNYKSTEGIVVKIKKWVTFTDITGTKQFRAPYSLMSDLSASEHDKERYTRGGNYASRERK